MNDADRGLTDEQIEELFSTRIHQRDSVGLYIDASVNMLIVDLIADQAVLVTDAYRQGQGKEKSDLRILAKATESGLVLVTYDRDFREIHERLDLLGLTHAGIIFVKNRTLKADPEQLAEHLVRLAHKFEGSADMLWNILFPL